MPENTADKRIKPFEPNQEFRIPFQLLDELFQYGEVVYGGRYHQSYEDYTNPEIEVTPKPKLPPKFAPLTLDSDPTRYYVVYFRDNRGNRDPDNRERAICISTQQYNLESNDYLREIIYFQTPKGMFVHINERINNSAHADTDIQNKRKAFLYKGNMDVSYQLHMNQDAVLDHILITRLDEIRYPTNRPVQLNNLHRSFSFDKHTDKSVYREAIRLNGQRDTKEWRDLWIVFNMLGDIQKPKSIDITIGVGLEEDPNCRVMFEDKERHIRVMTFARDITLYQNDPSLTAIFETPPDPNRLHQMVLEKIYTLHAQWNHNENVFKKPKSLGRLISKY